MSKLEELKELRNKLNLTVNSKENYPKDAPCIIISNHNMLLDIFYLPISINDDVVSLISSRIVYKKDLERYKIVEKYLNSFPIEAHGGKVYSDLCLKYANEILIRGESINIFPEDAYLSKEEGGNVVHRGRTGAARILFNALQNNKKVYFLPVSIDINSKDNDLDSYKLTKEDQVKINILSPIETNFYFYDYLNAGNSNDRNKALHDITDKGMKEIAKSLNRKYINQYIELYPKGNVIFSNGEKIDKDKAQNKKYVLKYEDELRKRTDKFINDLKK